MVTQVIKRDGRKVPYDREKIYNAVYRAFKATFKATGEGLFRETRLVTEEVERRLAELGQDEVDIERIQDEVERALMKLGYPATAKAYILYRQQHAGWRDISKAMLDVERTVERYLSAENWRVNENSNMDYSLQGLNNHIIGAVSSRYWLEKVYPPEIREAHAEGYMHIHDLGLLAPYCCGWDLAALLTEGFRGAPQKVESAPAKHFRSALGQIVNFFYTLQGEAAGAQALASFDTYLAPFVRYDGLSYKDVKQAIQEFIFNINVPTRVGFQCVSEDTEILTIEGWKKYNEVKPGMIIATFNIKSQAIEYLPVESVFARPYKGKMYRLKNRITDQLVSPRHRVVRRVFNSDQYVMEPVEKLLDLKTGPFVPVAGKGVVDAGLQEPIDMQMVKLAAWILADGSYDWNGKGSGRISIVQSPTKHPNCIREIEALLEPFKYSVRIGHGLGDDCRVYRINAEGTRKILEFFGFVDSVPQSARDIKFVPEKIKQGGREVCREFLRTYLRADGDFKSKISTASPRLRDDLMQVAVNAGYGVTCMTRRMDLNPRSLNKKPVYVLRLIGHTDAHITRIEEVDYEGVIWCPHTKNETVVARRKGKVFITGNTPFVNLTLDVKVPEHMRGEPVIIGGKRQDAVYGDFQKEMDMINMAFCEVMTEGDAKGRIFTFPIPTYNITKDFPWGTEVADRIMAMTAKYGIPYFANFINSDMKPEDVRSLCCRLRLDTRELRRRGGGLFGANPLTGSIGVVTLNLPRLAYMAAKEREPEARFFNLLKYYMYLAKESLLLKRKALERFTEQGLYPYSRFYLQHIKEGFGSYWANHFNTIGLVGMHEAALNLLGVGIDTPAGRELALKVLDFMREKLRDYQEETGQLFNLEATPAEGTSYRLARIDKERFPDIITSGEKEPYYTNSTQLPVNHGLDLFTALQHQDELQVKYTGGTVFHAFLGERITDIKTCEQVIRTVFNNFRLPYFSLTPTFSICPEHGYLSGEQPVCPHCGAETEVWSRVVGYYRPVKNWNKGKREEFRQRSVFTLPNAAK